MSKRELVVTTIDHDRLQELLHSQFAVVLGAGRPHIAELQELLNEAEIVAPNCIYPDIITMNSTIKLHDLVTEEAETFTLVYPDEACIAEGKLSILSPLGSQLLGRRVMEELTFNVQERKTCKRVDRIWFQPERVGAFNL